MNTPLVPHAVMGNLSPQQVLQHMEVPSQPGIFILGSLERRVTLYSQQVRALNLIHALLTTERLKKGQHVAVLGGGAAGLTAAAGAALHGCSVTVLERMHTLLPIFRNSQKRLLHPHLYDWPEEGWENEHAGLPVLDWSAGVASTVASQILRGWEEICQRHEVELHLDAKDIEVLSSTSSSHPLSWYTKQPHDRKFDVVILAVGFGIERTPQGVPHTSYWDDDPLNQSQRDPKHPLLNVLVSGTGDGGLLELLRARIEGFQHEFMVKDLLTGIPLERTCKELLDIERKVRNRPRHLRDVELNEQYKHLHVPPEFDERLQMRLRTDTQAVLNGEGEFPLSTGASILNRFLVSRLLRSKGGARYVPGAIQTQPAEAGYTVTFRSGRREHFDRLIVRHGAKPALSNENGFAWLAKEDIEQLRARNELDQTRYPLWPQGFFGSLSPGASPPPAAPRGPTIPSSAPPPGGLPPTGDHFGREELKKHLVEILLAPQPPPTTVLGAPGIGKSTLTIAALHDPEVQRRYDPHRYFVHLDGAKTAARLNSEIAQVLGLPPGRELPAHMATLFGGKPALLILDNAESPWEAAPQETEELLADLASIPRLALLLSVRGRVQPTLPRRGKPIEVPRLELDAARQLFRSIAWNVDLHHPRLEELLKAQEGLALAITLLAHAAQGVELDWTYRQWQRLRSKLLVRKEAQDRLGSIAISFELSLQSPRVTAAAKRLLRVLSRLPAGIAHGDLESVFPESLEAPSELQKAGLAFFENQRLRVLAPIREYMRSEHPPTPDDWKQATAYYSTLARQQGPQVGTATGAAALKRLVEEVPNLEVLLLDGLESDTPQAAIDTILTLNNFIRFSGHGTLDLMEQAQVQAQRLGDTNRVAQCTYTLGQLLLRRSQHARALELFQQSLPFFKQLEDSHGQARCLQSIGSVALDEGELEKAQDCFQRAIPLRMEMGDPQGIGNCLHGLGKVALSREQPALARAYFNDALLLSAKIDDDLVRAHCLRSLGELDADVRQLQQALELFTKVGDVRGMGHCLRGIADIALRDAQLERASELYQQAQQLLWQVGSVRGVANCFRGIGYVAHLSGDSAAARQAFERALENYRCVGDKPHTEECLQLLAGQMLPSVVPAPMRR
jgi:tetratricopeptide (TPR) repeat protein